MAQTGYFPPNAPAPQGGYPQGQGYMQGVPAGYPQAPPSYGTAVNQATGKFFKKPFFYWYYWFSNSKSQRI